jgi:hypothetical protein
MSAPSMLDIRMPIGLLFLVLGAILTTYGAVADPSSWARAGININLWWGLVLLVFGGTMWALGRDRKGSRSAGQ